MKLDFEVIKTMKGTNPDGSSITIQEGDEVRVIYDNTVNTGDDFDALHPDNTINARVYHLSKAHVQLADMNNLSYYLILRPKQIISIEHI